MVSESSLSLLDRAGGDVTDEVWQRMNHDLTNPKRSLRFKMNNPPDPPAQNFRPSRKNRSESVFLPGLPK